MERAGEILKRLQPSVREQSTNHSDEEDESSSCLICRGAKFVYPLKDNGKYDYSRTVPCECQKERIIKKRLSAMIHLCNLPSKTEHMTFANFRAYTKTLQQALSAAMEVANPEGSVEWLTLSGGVDTGKSHLAISICREWLNREQPAMYIEVPTLLDELKSTFNSGGESFDSKMFFYQNVPLLVLDDLGTEKPSEWAFEQLFTIINYRLMNGLHLVVTTNKALDSLKGDDEHRIASRLMRHSKGVVVVIDSPEYRTKKGR